MYCRRHEINGRVVFALCDKELIGKVLRENNTVIDLDKYRAFYIGNDMELLDGSFESINAAGKKSIEYLAKKGLIKKGDERIISDTPYIQIYRF